VSKGVLGGIRVLDLSMGWAGPLTAGTLAAFGAQVIKVESRGHLDWWRGGIAVFDMDDPNQPWERSGSFNAVNRNKLGITLDLSTEAGRALVRRLIQLSDVLVENFAPRVMEQFGLTYPSVRATNPSIIMLSMPAFGLAGPWREYSGVGQTTESMGGIAALCGYEDGPPVLQPHPYGDPIAGQAGVIAVLMALRHRRRTQQGQHIELAHIDAVTPHIGGPLMDYVMNGRVQPRRGNGSPVMSPHGCYPAAGDDRWVVIASGSDEQWRRLCTVMDRPELADDPRYRTLLGRLERRAEVDALVAEWTRTRDAFEITDLLQRQGIAAGPVASNADLAADPHLQQAGYFHTLARRLVGTHSYPTTAARLSRTPARYHAPAPLLGEHSAAVLKEILGLSDAEIDRLIEEGVTGGSPVVTQV
jgi:crotonobetainyl-CoA:carnitine CoA-transferase CaiB-like acyl-CoA transferase